MAKILQRAINKLKDVISPRINPQTDRTYPSNNITASRVNTILRNADMGDVAAQYALFPEIEIKDAHIRNVARTRKMAIAQLDWEIIPFSENAADIRKQEYIKEFFANMTRLADQHLDLLDGIWKGVAISEIIWTVKNGVVFADLKWVPQYMFTFPVLDTKQDPDSIRLKTSAFDMRGIELAQDKFVVHSPRSLSGLTRECGLCRSIVGGWFLKNYALKDWSKFIEKFGIPFLKGKYPVQLNADDPDIGVLKSAIQGFISDAGAIIPDNMDVEAMAVNQTGSGAGLHRELIKYWNDTITLLGLGQVMTTGQEGAVGSFARARVGKDVDAQLMRGDMRSLECTYRELLIRPAIKFQFGDEDGLPHFRFTFNDPVDLKNEAEVDDILVNKIGLDMPKSYFYEKYNRPRPENEEIVPGVKTLSGFVNSKPRKIVNKNIFELEQPTNREVVKYKNERMRDMKRREDTAINDGLRTFGQAWENRISDTLAQIETFEDVGRWLKSAEAQAGQKTANKGF